MAPFSGLREKSRVGESFWGHLSFAACCLDVRTLTFGQQMGFPLNH